MSGPLLSFGVRQNMSLSPRLQEAIRLLQMSAADFDHELREAADRNPFLEIQESEAAGPSADADAMEANDGPSPFTDVELAPSAGLPTATSATRGDGDDHDPTRFVAAPTGLRDVLREQLCASGAASRVHLAVEILIETLDDDGYLRDDPASSLAVSGIDPRFSDAEIGQAMTLLRGLDPAGVGARDLADCLALQLAASDVDPPLRMLALRLLHDGLDLLIRRDFAALRARLVCSEADVRDAYRLIRGLDPRPGARYQSMASDHVTPDVIVIRQGARLKIINNPELRPRTRLNHHTVELFRRCSSGRHPAMLHQLREARWLLRNAEQRLVTIQRVAQAIVDRQRDFFLHGDVALRPMVLREVADALGLHESTVSRASGNKTMITPRGLFEFKHFFSRQLSMSGGGSCSAAAVRAVMRTMIDGEDAQRPLSDVNIADLLVGQGIKVARRTVSKYRHLMRVLPAELRRQA